MPGQKPSTETRSADTEGPTNGSEHDNQSVFVSVWAETSPGPGIDLGPINNTIRNIRSRIVMTQKSTFCPLQSD